MFLPATMKDSGGKKHKKLYMKKKESRVKYFFGERVQLVGWSVKFTPKRDTRKTKEDGMGPEIDVTQKTWCNLLLNN